MDCMQTDGSALITIHYSFNNELYSRSDFSSASRRCLFGKKGQVTSTSSCRLHTYAFSPLKHLPSPSFILFVQKNENGSSSRHAVIQVVDFGARS